MELRPDSVPPEHWARLLEDMPWLGIASSSLVPASPGPRPTAPAAGDSTSRQVVARGADTVTLLPASPAGAAPGVEYDYTMPHCGVLGPIDVDGSFWDAGPGAGGGLDGLTGVFRLVTTSDAVFTAGGGATVGLTRHDGAKQFPICS